MRIIATADNIRSIRMEPVKVALSLVGIVVVIIACYYVTYYIGAKASGRNVGRPRNKNIDVIDRFAISRDKSFCIVKIAGKVYVIGVTNQAMTLLDTLDAAAFEEAAAEKRDTVILHGNPNGGLIGRLTYKLANFMARKMGKTTITKDEAMSAKFSDSMKAAREKDVSEGAGGSGQI